MTSARAALLFVPAIALASLVVSAQAPIPTIGAPPLTFDTTAAVPPPPPIPTTARERASRLETELATLVERKNEADSTLQSRARALYRIRRSGALPREGGFMALLERHGRLERLERVVVADLERSKDYARRVRAARSALEAAKADARGEALRETIATEQQAANDYAMSNLGMAALPPIPGGAPLDAHVADPSAPVAAAAPSSQSNGVFGALRGRLGLPVVSSIGMRDAVRDDGPGLEFLARPGTGVVAVADGRIAFAGDYGSYGRMIIIDHGDTFYTIYAGLDALSVRVGDLVATSQALGTVAGGRDPSLFFEVRRGTRSLDTRSWIGVTR